MKVLFICSGNKNNGEPGILVKNQALSLKQVQLDVQIVTIVGNGVGGYLKSIPKLRKHLLQKDINVVHAHYSLSAFAATFALIFSLKKTKMIVSLMGSDAQLKGWKRGLTRFFSHFFWHTTIVKSQSMANDLNLKKYQVLPNGVNLDLFLEKVERISNHVLFAADPSRPSKNFELAEKVMEKVKKHQPNVSFEVCFNVSHEYVIQKLKQTSCLLSTSRWEGSPNIIKEALAANTPIVSTNVGDVQWLLENVKGCFCTSFEIAEMVQSVLNALDFTANFGQTTGQLKIKELGLDAQSVAYQLKRIYER
jgi:glycosyltransferase involved in cell wall biosynthesis